MEKIGQIHYQFNEWEEAFKDFQENQLLYGEDIQLVLSVNPYTSGYWLENKRDDMQKGERVYRGKQVASLELRIRAEIQKAELEGRSPALVF